MNTSQVYITSNDGCLYKVFLDRDGSDEADGDFEGADGIDEFEDELLDGDGEEGDPKQKASKAGATANKPAPQKTGGEADQPKGKTGPSNTQPATATNGGKAPAGTTQGNNSKPAGTAANEPTGGPQANNTKPAAGGNPAANNTQPTNSLLKSKIGNKKYEDAEADEENF